MKAVSEKKNGSAVQARAVARHVRISPRKVRLVLDTIRRRHIAEAFSILNNLKKRAARVVEKVLKSAAANAKQKQMDEAKLIVRTAFADGGPVMKRHLPRAMGRADTILKRSAHITLVLEEGAVRRVPKDAGQADVGKAKVSGVRKLFKGKSEKKKEAAASA